MKLYADGISRRYFRNKAETNYFYAVEKTDFQLEEGKLTEVIGRSGSGKTTFSNMLAGLLTPTEGKVYLQDHDLYAMDDTKRSFLRNEVIGIIPQSHTGLASMTVLENVMAPAMMYHNTRKDERDAYRLLDQVGIADLSNVYSNELSGGELRRMAIARALINDPQVIIADEPTGDLDDETTVMVLKLLREYADRGASVLMITHEAAALEYADLVYRMDRGILTREK